MDGFFVFDLSNDLVFKYSNELMNDKLINIGRKIGIINSEEQRETPISYDELIHIFNPLLANLRFMLIQFDNSFNYVKCKHGFNMVFDDESFGFLLITISDCKTIEQMQRSQGVYKVHLHPVDVIIVFLTIFTFLGIHEASCWTSSSSVQN